MNLMMQVRKRAAGFAVGQTMTEYVLIVSAIAIVLIGGYNALGGTLKTMIVAISSAL